MRLSNQLRVLLEEIEKKKSEMSELAERTMDTLAEGPVLQKSQELDLLIVRYQHMLLEG